MENIIIPTKMEDDYRRLKVPELRDIARRNRVRGYPKLKKEELIG